MTNLLQAIYSGVCDLLPGYQLDTKYFVPQPPHQIGSMLLSGQHLRAFVQCSGTSVYLSRSTTGRPQDQMGRQPRVVTSPVVRHTWELADPQLCEKIVEFLLQHG